MTDQLKFSGSFTQQVPIPERGILAATQHMRSGQMHRYGAPQNRVSETSLLEQEYAEWQGSKYCLALGSGGAAIQIALRAAGLQPGDHILMNAFTLAPVPGAITAVGATPVLVEIDENLTIDLSDLQAKARSSKARFLLLSHMRGHMGNMQRIMEMAEALDLFVIEDCAHTMGASWNGIKSGNFGNIACFSTQSYKHINSGEGGLLTTNNPDVITRAIFLSGSYRFHHEHLAAAPISNSEAIAEKLPNLSCRMDEVRAAMLRPQIEEIESRVNQWNIRHDEIARFLRQAGALLAQTDTQEERVGSSIQFRLPEFSYKHCEELLHSAASRGVALKWFGAAKPSGYTSTHHSWRYFDTSSLQHTDQTLRTLFDMRISLSFSLTDCRICGTILSEEISRIRLD